MRRSIALAGFALFALILARPVAAQQQAAASLADPYADGKSQLSRIKKYSGGASSKGYMSAPRSSLHFNPADASGRIDMSGHAPAAFYKFRDPKSNLSNFSTGTHAAAAVRRRPAPRTNYSATPKPGLRGFTATSSRRDSLPPIPPPPL